MPINVCSLTLQQERGEGERDIERDRQTEIKVVREKDRDRENWENKASLLSRAEQTSKPERWTVWLDWVWCKVIVHVSLLLSGLIFHSQHHPILQGPSILLFAVFLWHIGHTQTCTCTHCWFCIWKPIEASVTMTCWNSWLMLFSPSNHNEKQRSKKDRLPCHSHYWGCCAVLQAFSALSSIKQIHNCWLVCINNSSFFSNALNCYSV